ncbi:MAG: helix-turn-helix transcriptional regulator [Bacteroidota bacterium]
MSDQPKHIKFQNRTNPGSGYDMLRLEDLFKRSEMDHSPFNLHRVEFYMILLITGGAGKHTVDFTKYNCQRGTILTIRKDQLQKFHQSNLEGTILIFTNDFLVSYLEELEALRSIQLFNEVIAAPNFQLDEKNIMEILSSCKRISKEYFDINDAHSLGIIRSELHILISKLFRLKSKSDPKVYDRKYLSEFIEFQRLVEQKASISTKVKDYAKMMGLSPKTLNNITRAILDKSAKAFVDEICTKQIKRLLINTTLSIKEIAYETGFEETTNFYKYFKRQTQLTPEAFRQKNR